MSKELLEALREARNFRHEKDKNLVVIDIDYFNKCLDGIESELKENATLEEDFKQLYKLTYKEHKALEIIRKKQVDVNTLIVFITRFPKDKSEYGLETYNAYVKNGRELAQEEFDLLKEMLL